jgi:hypothetical protein
MPGANVGMINIGEMLGKSMGNKEKKKKMTVKESHEILNNDETENYKICKNFKKYKRYLLVKYEDLILNRDETFLKILKFIFKLRNIDFSLDHNKFKKMIDTTTFDNLKNLENKEGFKESIKNKKTGENPGIIKSNAAKAIAAPEIISYAGGSFLLS